MLTPSFFIVPFLLFFAKKHISDSQDTTQKHIQKQLYTEDYTKRCKKRDIMLIIIVVILLVLTYIIPPP